MESPVVLDLFNIHQREIGWWRWQVAVGVGFLFEGEEESRVALKCLITVPQEYINQFCSFDLIFPSIITNMVFSLQHGTLSISTVAGKKN